MGFSKKYLQWLILPPALITLPLAGLFLSQVIQLSVSRWLLVAGLMIGIYGASAFVFWRPTRRCARNLESVLAGSGDVGKAMSDCLEATKRSSIRLTAVGGLLFTMVATVLLLPTFLGFSYFLVSAFIIAALALPWIYATAKNLLLEAAPPEKEIRFVGPLFPLSRKVALLFIGLFLVSSAALVQIVSSKVSTTLENLAISSESERFARIFDSAQIGSHVDQNTLEVLKSYIPATYSLAVVPRKGNPIYTGQPLSSGELTEIRRSETGDSSHFISPHVMKFKKLKDGSILVLSIPWAPYRNVPLQITFYTLITALFTSIIFSLATYLLSRDTTVPIQELMKVSEEMARGNFQTPPRIFSDDEVGRLGDTMGATRTNLQRLIARVGGSGATITEGVKVITGGTDSLSERSRQQASLTEGSTIALNNVRQGIEAVLHAAEKVTDLTQDSSSRTLELQASAEEVARSMDYLFQSVEKTSNSTTEMNASAKEMSGRMDTLAGIGEDVLSFVTQMDSTIDELRKSAEETALLSNGVRGDAEAGGKAVNESVKGIHVARDSTRKTAKVIDDLQGSIGQISQILKVIVEITDRTNLLSLNAAIIAAQAGEHGLGFSVVADEIRELAERTRGSTKEIGGIIKAIQAGAKEAVAAMHEGVERVDQNVSLAQNAASSLLKIVTSSGRSFEMATRISTALGEQSVASRHLHEVTSRMSDHISAINRSTQEQAATAKLMAEEAERVREIALQVRNATDEQSVAGGGIAHAMEQITLDARTIRDLLQKQLEETERISRASTQMLTIAQENDAIAQDFNSAVRNLVKSGLDFESEVKRFKLTETAN